MAPTATAILVKTELENKFQVGLYFQFDLFDQTVMVSILSQAYFPLLCEQQQFGGMKTLE